jgi:hypothetical protein
MGRSLASLLCLTIAAACGVDQAGSAPGLCSGPDCIDAGALASSDVSVEVFPLAPEAGAPTAADPDAGLSTVHPICAGSCLPDDALACVDFDPENDAEGRALYANADAQLLMVRQLLQLNVDAGVVATDTESEAPSNGADASVVLPPGASQSDAGSILPSEPVEDEPGNAETSSAEASAGEAGGDETSSDETSSGETSSDEASSGEVPAPLETHSCQIDRQSGTMSVGCALAGTGADSAPCTSSRDCVAGFGCVGEAGAGQCLKFCCEGNSVCSALDGRDVAASHFCDDRPLLSANTGNSGTVDVPVCVVAEQCDLAEPYPCPAGASCTCTEGKVCTVVNGRGATGCREPGEGLLDDDCPCAAGFFCHPVENTCKQLCDLEHPETCGDSICQANANFQQGWGLCQPVAPATP